ncbi:MAG: type II toxin-antitoxin system VapC family toxin [Candidatus Dormibacteria bacterium]
MIVDSSALITVLLQQALHEKVEVLLARAPIVAVGSPTLVETGIVLAARLGPPGPTPLARMVEETGLVIVPFTDAHARVAIDAFRRFGRGRHSARLNFADCLTYATAWVAGQPLLCTGDDFIRTDLDVLTP